MARDVVACASLVPQVVPLKLHDAQGRAVYDVFAGKQVQPVGGMLQADCRNMPARVFAILPAAVAHVHVESLKTIERGETMWWKVRVTDDAGKDIAAAVPVRVRLLASDGRLLDQRYDVAAFNGGVGEFIFPINAPAGAVTLEAVELLSGKVATLKIPIDDARPAPLDLLNLADASVLRVRTIREMLGVGNGPTALHLGRFQCSPPQLLAG